MKRRLGGLLVLAVSLFLVLPTHSAAQVAGSGTKISIAGSGFVGSDFTNLSNIFGLTRFTESGFEFGGDIVLSVSKSGDQDTEVSGFAFGRLNYNFIGESTFVPFITVGAGVPLEDDSFVDFLANVGVGFKKFLNERVSFDAQAMVQGTQQEDFLTGESTFEVDDGVSLFYGLSIYLGGS